MPVPVCRTRRARRLVVAVALVLGPVAGGACAGDDGTGGGESAEEVPSGEVGVFDSAVVHAIDLEFDQEDYDAMIETYADSGEKAWIEATVTVDGVTYERVGLRLKGNSSLAGLGGGGGGPGGRTGGADADDPAGLPWLIRFDKFVEDQRHQGYEDIVIRSNSSETSLNEAVALDLLAEAGLASQRAVATSFAVNGGEAVLRLAVEHPDDDAWQDANFDSDGALYKAEASGSWDYRGDDPADYEDVFDQEGGKKVADLTPLIELLQFIEESDDETFADELDDHLDTEAFATYLAAMDVLDNFDDIDGPGNNAYLWYDVESERFTIVPWDMNLALGGGGFGSRGGAGPGGGGEPPQDFEPPADGEVPEGPEPPGGGQRPGRGGPGGGGFGGGNPLVERFHENETFEALYQDELSELRASLYDSGEAQEVLDRWVDVLKADATDLVDGATVDEEAEAVATHFEGE